MKKLIAILLTMTFMFSMHASERNSNADLAKIFNLIKFKSGNKNIKKKILKFKNKGGDINTLVTIDFQDSMTIAWNYIISPSFT